MHGNVHNNVQNARKSLNVIQDQLAINPTDISLVKNEHEASKILDLALVEQAKLLLQKSRVKWLKQGDGNNSFFFNKVKANWNQNKVLDIENKEGVGQASMSQVAVEYFQNSIGRPSNLEECDLHSKGCKTIIDHQGSLMEAIVTPELVYKILKTMKRNKAPGPHGFTVEFFLDSWEIVGQDFCRAIRHFFNSSHMHPGINLTSIALIPKENNPTTMGGFRPISLYSVAYKCFAKIIANRLEMVLPEVINIA